MPGPLTHSLEVAATVILAFAIGVAVVAVVWFALTHPLVAAAVLGVYLAFALGLAATAAILSALGGDE